MGGGDGVGRGEEVGVGGAGVMLVNVALSRELHSLLLLALRRTKDHDTSYYFLEFKLKRIPNCYFF